MIVSELLVRFLGGNLRGNKGRETRVRFVMMQVQAAMYRKGAGRMEEGWGGAWRE